MDFNSTISDGLSTDLTTEFIENNDYNQSINEQLKFIVVPLIVIAAVMILSAMVFLMARKRRLDILRHRLMPLYNFDKAENENDWETDFLNNIDNPNYTDYCTTKFNNYDN